ncbi:restriction endonuclease subunit S [Candidatus Woesearchaeota archaeon]|nr:restriction endonuclease subunit S [Candidatus Woesearchaeota archaeon]MBT7555468.1 restriction endonuclease subunit S [Candidatus Woesearchaeota archaeon]
MINNYVDSGVEWLQDIPSHWGVKTIKKLFTESNTKNTEGNTNYLSIVKDKGVVLYSDKGNVGNKTSDHPEKYKMVEVGDIVINPMNIIIGSVGRSKYEGCLSSVYIVLKSNKGISSNYYEYIFSHKLFQKYLKRICYGIMELRESLNKIEFYVEKLPVPPLQEQQQISDYLDYKTSKIDTLIEKTQQKIELLKEQRISLINTTVTKGLDPNVEMKDSGVEWIGDIPSDWKVKKLTYVTNSIGSGTTPKTSNSLFYEEGHIPWLNTGDLNDGYIYKTKKKVTKLAIEKHTSLKVFPINSVSIAMYGATIGKLGLFKIPVTVNQANCVFVFDEVNVSKFWFYVLMEYRPQIVSLGYGGGQPNISQDLLKSLRFGCPSYKNQQQIVDYLDKETSKIDKLVDIESKRIVLLKEYRQSLISEVVTGKVDVRDEVLL